MEAYREVATQGVAFLSREELMRPAWDLPDADRQGYIRGAARGIRTERVSIAVGLIPSDQGSPAHKSDAEHLFFGLAGTLRFHVGDNSYTLTRGDTLYVAVGVGYKYANPGAETAEFLDVVVRVGPWPPSAQPM